MLPEVPVPLLAIGFDDLAQLAIFAILAIGAAIQHAVKKKAEQARHAPGHRRVEPGHEHEEFEGRHPPPLPARPAPRAKPVPRPVATPVERAAIPAAPTAPSPGSGSGHGHHGGRLKILADPRKRGRALSGRPLLFAKDATPHDRIRAAVLWNEVLRPPPALGG